MRRSLQSHIAYLEKLIQEVADRLIQPGLAEEEMEDLRLQLFSAQGALEHYRQAYALELSAAGSEPPPKNGDTRTSGDGPTPKNSNSGQAKAGRAAPGTRPSKRHTRRDRIALALSPFTPHTRTRLRRAERVGRDRAA